MSVVRIIEDNCIGCTKCIDACPVDAIVGATQVAHAVLTEFCIGCELCLPACPVSCIEIIATETKVDSKQRAQIAKSRVQSRNARLAKREAIKAEKDRLHALNVQNEIQAAIARSAKRKKFVWNADE